MMQVITALLLLLAGVLALSGLIVQKRPDAKRVIDQLVPFQALIGVGLLVLGVLNLLWCLGNGIIGAIAHTAVFGLTFLSLGVTSILLGFLFGVPQIAKWAPGHAEAEQKAYRLMAQLAPYQVVLGGIAIATGLLALLYRSGIINPLTF